MVLHLRQRVEHFRYGWRVPLLPSPMDRNPMSLLQPMVAAFGLVCAVMRSPAAANPVLLPKPKPRATGLALIMPPIRSREVACVHPQHSAGLPRAAENLIAKLS